MIAKEQSFGAGEPFPGAAANAAIVVPDTRNFMAQFVPLIDVVLIAIAVHKHDGIDLDQRFRTVTKLPVAELWEAHERLPAT